MKHNRRCTIARRSEVLSLMLLEFAMLYGMPMLGVSLMIFGHELSLRLVGGLLLAAGAALGYMVKGE